MKYFYFFLLNILALNGIAQKPYVPMESVNSWYYSVSSLGGFSTFWVEDYGDTIINDLEYRKIGYDTDSDFVFMQYIREDIDQKKIYIINAYDASMQEVVIYDFSLEVGDILASDYYNGATYEVIEKELIPSLAGDLYQWTLQLEGGDLSFKYIESLGSDFFFVNPLISDPVYSLVCAYYDCTQVFGSSDCMHLGKYGISESLDVELCEGEEYMGITEEGSYQIRLGNDQANECDTLLELTISFKDPSQPEIPYNGIDDDCDPFSRDDDLDEDGFLAVDDCDDEDPNINPDAEEIVNNGVDEDCDGMDLLSSLHELSQVPINIFPNPVHDNLIIELGSSLNYRVILFSLEGKILIQESSPSTIFIGDFLNGIYILVVEDIDTGNRVVEKIVKE